MDLRLENVTLIHKKDQKKGDLQASQQDLGVEEGYETDGRDHFEYRHTEPTGQAQSAWVYETWLLLD